MVLIELEDIAGSVLANPIREFTKGTIKKWDFEYCLNMESVGLQSTESSDIVSEIELNIKCSDKVYLTKFNIACEYDYKLGVWIGEPTSYVIISKTLISKLDKEYKILKEENWKPVDGENFYTLDLKGDIECVVYDEKKLKHLSLIEHGNYFRTEELAKVVVKDICEVFDYCRHT